MADGKLTYDIDFNVNTSKISEAIASAVSRASSLTYSTPTPTSYMDLSVMNLADRIGAGWGFYDRVRNNLGIGSEFFQEQGVNSLSEFAALATSQKYGYTPSTTQMIINSAVAAALRSSQKKPDMQWKFEMESMTNDVRAAQREQAKSSLAYEYAQQGRMFANAAAMAATPEAQRRLLGAASSRYASIASRTLVESGAVSPEDAAVALSTAAELSSIGSGIKTQAQIAAQQDRANAQRDKLYVAMGASLASKEAQEDAAWATREYGADRKAREMERGFAKIESASAALASEVEANAIASRSAIMGARYRIGQDAKREITLRANIAAQKESEYNLIAAEAGTQAAQEDAAWSIRAKQLSYSESKKAREMEKGFRAMEASSATEAIYNPNSDPSVQRWNYGASLYAAAQYAADAEKAPAGSPERSAYIALAKESMRGITVSGMAQSGMHKDELVRNTTALIGLTNLLKTLSGEDGEPEVTGGGWFSNPRKVAAAAAALVNTGFAVTRDVMQGRTQWLADTQSPYQTRRDVRQGWAMKYGEQARKLGVGAGALAGASVGTAILPGIGTVVGGLGGALVGAIPGGVAELWGQHNADEKKIGDAYQQRAVDMLKYRNLYGNGVEYNYAQFAGDTGYISASGMLQLNQAADMLPGAMMFGAVDERQMMALSYMPNYWRALMAGASTSELASAYAGDITSLPREMQQYITSLLPGASEDLRAFVKSEGFSALQGNAGVYRGYDENQYGMATGYDRARQVIAHRNVASLNRNMTNETAVASAPNYYRSDSAYAMAMSDYDAIYETDPSAAEDAWSRTRRKLGLREFDVGNTHGKLGDIIIQIDGNTIYQEEYSTESFISGLQSYVVGV